MKRILAVILCVVMTSLPIASVFGEIGDYGTQEFLQEHNLIVKADNEVYEESEIKTPNKSDVEKRKTNIIYTIALVESIFIFNAYWASKNPTGYGAACGLVFFPLAAINGRSETSSTMSIISFALAELQALYIYTNTDKSEEQLFIDNMVLWHVYGICVGITYMLTDKPEKAAMITPILAPGYTGMSLSKRF